MLRIAKKFLLSIIKYIHVSIVPIILVICLSESVYILMLHQDIYFSAELYRIVLEDNVRLSIDNYNLNDENSYLKERCGIDPEQEENDNVILDHTQKLKSKYINWSLYKI